MEEEAITEHIEIKSEKTEQYKLTPIEIVQGAK